MLINCVPVSKECKTTNNLSQRNLLPTFGNKKLCHSKSTFSLVFIIQQCIQMKRVLWLIQG
jgi:hypothetical protein